MICKLQTRHTEVNYNNIIPTYNPVAWKTYGGKKIKNNNGIILETLQKSFQEFDINNFNEDSVEINLSLKIDSGTFGFKIKSNRGDYSVLFNLQQNYIALYKNGRYFDLVNKRKFIFNKESNYSIKMIIQEGNLEIYINDVLILQGGIPTDNEMEYGVGVYNGKSLINDIKFISLEK